MGVREGGREGKKGKERKGETAQLYMDISSVKKTDRNLRLGIMKWTYLGWLERS